jgi:hypothetical protein
MLKIALQTEMMVISYPALLILSLLAFVIMSVVLWRRGKTVEALLVWNSMFLYIIALILLLK